MTENQLRECNLGPLLIVTSFIHIVLSRMTDDTPNVAAMVEESLQLLEVSVLLCPIDGSTSHQHIGVFREFEMGELVIHRINQLGTVITSYRLGKFSMKCKVVSIFGEKLVNIHFYII